MNILLRELRTEKNVGRDVLRKTRIIGFSSWPLFPQHLCVRNSGELGERELSGVSESLVETTSEK